MNLDETQGHLILERGHLDRARLSAAWRHPERLKARDFVAFLRAQGALAEGDAAAIRALAAARCGPARAPESGEFVASLLGPQQARPTPEPTRPPPSESAASSPPMPGLASPKPPGLSPTVVMPAPTAGPPRAPSAGAADSEAPLPCAERFERRGLLGQGGMGVVERVYDHLLERELAFKHVRPDAHSAELAARFERELKLTAKLEHPAVPPVYDAGVLADGRPYMLMRLLQGETLKQRLTGLTKTRRLEAQRPALLELLLRVSEAVAFAHEQGVVHRDLKPDNIMVGGFGAVFVMDWGIARDLAESSESDAALKQSLSQASWSPLELNEAARLTQDKGVLGTPGYIAPEQAAMGVDAGPRGDVFALGAILTELLTGAPAIAGKTSLARYTANIKGEVRGPRSIDSRVPASLDSLALRALAQDPGERLASARAFSAELRRTLSGHALESHRYSLGGRLNLAARRHAGPLLAASLTLTALAAGAALSLQERERARRSAEQATRRERRAAKEERNAEAHRAKAAELAAATAESAARAKQAAAAAAADNQASAAREASARARALEVEDVRRLPELIGEAAGLWPYSGAHPRQLEAWIAEATAQLDRRATHTATTRTLTDRQLEGDAVRGDADQLRPQLRRQQELVDHLKELEALAPLLEELRARLDRARAPRPAPRSEDRARWVKACAGVAENPLYKGAALTPRGDLSPLGPDPDSGLEEFAVLATGAPPRRDARGRLALDASSAAVLVLVPPGRCQIGDELGRPYDRPVHDFEVPAPFFLGKHELSWAQWHRAQRSSLAEPAKARFPVDTASWLECQALCLKLGFALPPERAWEYACRAGTETRYWTGTNPESLVRGANLKERWSDGFAGLAPIGQLEPNAFGLHDTVGNVWERCSDGLTASYSEPAKRPGLGPEEVRAVIRGGGYVSARAQSYSAHRSANPIDLPSKRCGLRLYSEPRRAP